MLSVRLVELLCGRASHFLGECGLEEQAVETATLFGHTLFMFWSVAFLLLLYRESESSEIVYFSLYSTRALSYS